MLLRTRTLALVTPRTLTGSLLLSFAGALALILFSKILIPLPFTPVPVSLSVLGVLLLGGLLGPRLAPAAVAQFLIFGLAGVPVFSAPGAGLAVFAGATGGYLLAFPVAAALYGLLVRRLHGTTYTGRLLGNLLAGLAAVAVIYLGGWAWLVGVLHLAPAHAYAAGVQPFAAIDLGKAALAAAFLALL
jgi:biotin transport system substrate-specific component